MYGSTLIFAADGLAAVGRWCYPWLKLRDLSTAWRERPQRNAFFFLAGDKVGVSVLIS
jgi:hypothetical protein